MSGHSKWASIKHKKGALDAKRGQLFTRLGKEIMIAARSGGDPDGNARLRTAIANAKANRMPKDNIERAVKRGTGELDGGQLEELMFEGYAAGGVAVIVECLTDNRNRTSSEVKFIMGKYGGNLGTSGCVSHQFVRKGVIQLQGEGLSEDKLMELGLELDGFEDLTVDEDGAHAEIRTESGKVTDIQEALEKAGYEVQEAKVVFVSDLSVKLEGKTAVQALRLIEMLEESEDVQAVHSNLEIDDAEMENVLAIKG